MTRCLRRSRGLLTSVRSRSVDIVNNCSDPATRRAIEALEAALREILTPLARPGQRTGLSATEPGLEGPPERVDLLGDGPVAFGLLQTRRSLAQRATCLAPHTARMLLRGHRHGRTKPFFVRR